MYKIALILFSFLLIFETHAQDLPLLRSLRGYEVIFQSTDVKYVKSLGLYKTRVVSKRGIEVFEVSDAYFKCTASRCRLVEVKIRALYETCSRKKQNRFACKRRIEFSYEAESETHGQGYWEMHAEGESIRVSTSWEDEEFPSRSQDSWESDGVVLF